MVRKGKYVMGYVDDQFIIVSLETLGEIYQEDAEETVRLFDNDSEDVKLETFENYKDECIANDGEEAWEDFYNEWKAKF